MCEVDITQYDDYRVFLNDLYWSLKKTKKTVSFQNFADEAGTSRSYLKLIVSQKRHTNLDMLVKIANYLGMTDLERMYFTFLFLKCTSQEENQRKYFQQVLSMFKNRVPLTDASITPDRVEYSAERESFFGDWLSMTIHALAMNETEISSVHVALACNPGVLKEDIEKSIQHLTSVGAVTMENGKIKSKQAYFKDFSGFYDPQGMQRYINGLQRVQQALKTPEIHRPLYTNYSVSSLTDEQFTQVRAKLYEALNLMEKFSSEDNTQPKKVYLMANGFCMVAHPPVT